MAASAESATPQQVSFLEQHGYTQTVTLSRTEAAEVIRRIRQGEPVSSDGDGGNRPEQGYSLGLFADLSGALPRGSEEAMPLLQQRYEFWLDTCREATQRHGVSSAAGQVHELHQRYGCRFSLPSTAEVQEVLDALDLAIPGWERNHPELFYSTLELNFPELLKRVA